MVSNARKKASKTYSDKMDVIKSVKLNRKTDKDILDYLEKSNVTNFTGLVKELIREQIKKEEE